MFLLSLFLLLLLFLGLELDQLDTPLPLPSQVIFYRPQEERDCTQGVSSPMWLSHFWGRSAWWHTHELPPRLVPTWIFHYSDIPPGCIFCWGLTPPSHCCSTGHNSPALATRSWHPCYSIQLARAVRELAKVIVLTQCRATMAVDDSATTTYVIRRN